MSYIKKVMPGEKHYSDRMITSANEGVFLSLGKIVHVDYENLMADIVFLDKVGGIPKVPITAPYAGYRSFLGAMPAVNDWVILGFSQSGGFKKPLIVQYLPRGYAQGIENEKIKTSQEFQDRGLYKPLRFKMRKLYEGELYGASKYGSEFYLDKNVSISNSKLNEILLRSSDQSISFSALNTYMSNCGIRTYTGLIHRNELISVREPEDPEFPTYFNEDGVAYYTPVYTSTIDSDYPYGKETIVDNKEGFIEHRIEVKEMNLPILPVSAQNSGVDLDSLYRERNDGESDKPLVTQVLGTLVGNDPIGSKDTYGKVLKPKIFPNLNTLKGNLAEEACVCSDGINEISTLAAAYTLKTPNTKTAFYINKQGKYFASIDASTSIDSLGGGESAEINLLGHTKMYMGKNDTQNRSLSLGTDGGVYTNWGFDKVSGRSWDATFRKGISWNVLGKDKDNVSWRMRTEGDVSHIINGSRFTEIKGNDIKLVHGILEDRVLGKKVDNFVNDKATNYGGSYNETAIGAYNQTLSSGRYVTIAGPNSAAGQTVADKTEVILGNSEYKMKLGNKKEEILVGNHETVIGAGNKSINISAGNYNISVTAGNIDIKTTIGTVNVKTAAGNVTIEGNLGVTVKSKTKIKIEAPQVSLGKIPGIQQGGIVNDGPQGHRCYITGGPHLGSKTVTCNTL